AEKEESQEICFVPDGDYAGFIERYLEAEGRTAEAPTRGEIVDTSGARLGEHEGIHRYTVGQRRGLGVSRQLPLYVVRIEPEQRRVVVGDADALLGLEFEAVGINWIAFEEPLQDVRAQVRVRYRHTPAQATITPLTGGRVRVRFDEPQRAITPGQATVFYHGEEVLGGGWIAKNSVP
ncbi:MAG TPA: aminomethyltransferase beta-barrel domain-containing protein, partial [Pyrinomonadaceae bacterium]